MSADDLITMAEFARRLGVGRSYVTQLRKEGRLVQDERGRVDEAASRQLIAQTADPDKASKLRDVAADTAPAEAEPAAMSNAQRLVATTQSSKALQAHYQALSAKRDYEVSIGELLERRHVISAIADATVTLRSQMEALPATIAAQLALTTDEREIRALLADEVQRVLTHLSNKFKEIARRNQE